MPRIFEKNCKVNLIEYGGNTSGLMSLDEIQNSVSQAIMSFIKK